MTAQITGTELPVGFEVQVRADVRRLDGGRLLLGGSPLRALRLSAAGARLIDDNRLVARDDATARLARRLLDGNLADPVLGHPVPAEELTVVVPVRDRAVQLDRCLAALAGLRLIVVDDASHDPGAVRAVTERHGAQLLPLSRNAGPAAARNAGLALVTTPAVALVDSDVEASATMLRALAAHLDDPRVALAGPLVGGVARSPRPRWFERYDVAASSLALGTRPCSVKPGAAVAWLPSACLVARTEALRAADGFAADMRVGEDVDLVWRLVEAGWSVRYDPAHVALHDVRATISGWLGRKVVYGTGGAGLAERHGDAVAPAVLSPAMAVAAMAVLQRRWWSAPVGIAAWLWGARAVRRSLPSVAGRDRQAARVAVTGLGWAVRQESALLLRHWWPATAFAGLVSRRARRAVLSALLVDAAVQLVAERRHQDTVNPVIGWAGRRLDDLAFGSGLWAGAFRARSARCLLPKLVTPPPRRRPVR